MYSTKKLIPILSISSLIGLITLVGVVTSQSKGNASACYASMTMPTPEQSINPNESTTDDSHRENCPGKILCPVNGKIICKDRCPLHKDDSHRANCPGKILCPVNGKIICKDRCPLNNDTNKVKKKSLSIHSPCCSTKKG